jgi:hypothetical protein
MSSFHRIGATVAGLATVATVAGAFVAQGYVAAQQAAQQSAQQAAGQELVAQASSAPQVVYVRPMPSPQVVTPPQPTLPPPPVIHIVVPSHGDDGGSDN